MQDALQKLYADMKRRDLETRRKVMQLFPCVAESPERLRWRQELRVLAVQWDNCTVYPAFQFDEAGQPLPVIAAALRILQQDPKRTDWQNLFWFVSANGWLGGPSPKECLSDPARIVDVAGHEVIPDDY